MSGQRREIFCKVKFINLEDFSLLGHSIPLPHFDLKIKKIDLNIYFPLFFKRMSDSHLKAQEHLGKN